MNSSRTPGQTQRQISAAIDAVRLQNGLIPNPTPRCFKKKARVT